MYFHGRYAVRCCETENKLESEARKGVRLKSNCPSCVSNGEVIFVFLCAAGKAATPLTSRTSILPLTPSDLGKSYSYNGCCCCSSTTIFPSLPCGCGRRSLLWLLMAATARFCFLVMVVMAGTPDGLGFTAPALVSGADVSLGTILRASDTTQWMSPSKAFSFGFTKYQQNPSLFVAGVTHSASTILVWTAGDPSPAVVDGGASLTFSSDGNLRLLNGSGTVVWHSGTGNKGVSAAGVEDSGKFFLKNGSSTVWDTFSHPADVLVQEQNFLVGQTLRSGPYSFEFNNSNVELLLKWNISIVYWSISNSSIAGKLTSPALVLDRTGVVTLVDALLSAPSKWIYSSDYSSDSAKFRFLRLDSDGNLRAYSFDGTNLSPQWSAVEDQCLVYGWCGNNGMCVYNDKKPVCTCISQDFVPVDSGDPR